MTYDPDLILEEMRKSSYTKSGKNWFNTILHKMSSLSLVDEPTLPTSRIYNDELSDNQLYILILTSHGWTDEEIAKELDTTIVAVKGQLKECRRKLGSRGTPNAVAIAIRRNII